MDLKNPFNPMRFTGRGGLLTIEESSRLQDLIRNQAGTFIRNLEQIFQALNVSITNNTTTGGAGAAGAPGRDGADGDPGDIGPPGRDGVAGARGLDGASGPPGADGEEGAIGPPGGPGPVGAAGSTGAQGPMGPPMFGADGDDGPEGVPGLPGAAGTRGLDGAPGPPGVEGDAGADGPPGGPGPTGAAGQTGPQGPMGPPGMQPEPGEDGRDSLIPGPPGAAGAAGAAGPMGPPGADGGGDGGRDGGAPQTSPSPARFWLSIADSSVPFGVDMGALGTGILRQTVSGGVSTPGLVTVSTGLTYVSPTLTVNLSTGIAGGQSAIGGTAASENLSFSSTTNGTKGKFIFGSTTGMQFDESTNVMTIGIATPSTGTVAQWKRSDGTNGVNFYLQNPNTGTGLGNYAGLTIGSSDTIFSSAYFGFWWYNTTVTGSGFITPGTAQFQLHGGSGNIFYDLNQNTGDHIFATTTSATERMRIANGGNVSIANLTAGGVVYATAATGVLKIGTSADVASAITWPAADRILYSSGTTTAPIGQAEFVWDTGDDAVSINGGSYLALYNLGTVQGDTNYERLNIFRSANVYNITSQKKGSGTVRAIKLDADTATLTLNGGDVATTAAASITLTATTDITLTASDDILLTAGDVMESYGTSQWTSGIVSVNTISTGPTVGITLGAHAGRTSGAAATWDAVVIDTAVQIAGTTTIATAAGFNAMTLLPPAVTTSGAGLTVTSSATLYIQNASQAGPNVTITNPYAVWVDAGISRFDGNGTFVFELPADATGNVTAATGRVPIKVGGATKYLRYFDS